MVPLLNGGAHRLLSQRVWCSASRNEFSGLGTVPAWRVGGGNSPKHPAR